ncbi:BolA family protein [Vibrio marisflavi]|uniref:DNA-binding transcriptional regulator BolA n=1 Tax=Vibrio marisflavi CECT 7928 TaxID=634439 RepID=A0ABN8E6L4_9VIBR|nr:BolA/IbaG family iron-sulfur metabolism protein [Vibrio marisflavi]CAH0541033.1 DNA-binding transcriptional regulator BolA [Vibrio marisflavi CECT 7928]
MIKDVLETKLTEGFEPTFLKVINESYMHNVPEGSESHFKVVVVSTQFEGQRLVARHRAVNQVLSNELANNIHALSIKAYTPEEWQENGQVIPETPPCMGGDKK